LRDWRSIDRLRSSSLSPSRAPLTCRTRAPIYRTVRYHAMALAGWHGVAFRYIQDYHLTSQSDGHRVTVKSLGRIAALAAFAVVAIPAAQAAETSAAEKLALAVRLERGVGMPRSYARALELYCEAANQGSGDAAYNAAWMYLHGVGMRRDTPNGIAWLRVA